MTAYNTTLTKTHQNDDDHDKLMTEIAKRGGKTLKQLRAMRMEDKDAFILKYRSE